MKRLISALAALSLSLIAAGAAADKGNAPESAAVTKEIIDAIAAELERAAASLRIGGAAAPYFIGYKITEVDVNDVSASMGSTTSEKRRHFVTLEAHVHVGSYQRDNSNFVAAGREGIDGIATVPMPLEATPEQARRAAWLVTDAAYKEALEQARAKAEALASGAQAVEADSSYARVKPLVIDKSVPVPALETDADMRKKAEEVSAVYRDLVHVRDSRVALTTFLERRWYPSTAKEPVPRTRAEVSGVLIAASSQAQDGQPVALYFTRYGRTGDDLPGTAELKKVAGSLSGQLDQLRTAPLAETYTGPVLFEGQGAIGIVRETLAPHLSGTSATCGRVRRRRHSLRWQAHRSHRIARGLATDQRGGRPDPLQGSVNAASSAAIESTTRVFQPSAYRSSRTASWKNC